MQAQLALGVRRGRLLDSSGTVLGEGVCIMITVIQDGDSLTLHINRVPAFLLPFLATDPSLPGVKNAAAVSVELCSIG